MSLGFYFDGTRCMSCKVCQVSCKDRFDLQKPGPKPRRVTLFEKGTFPNTAMSFLSVSCNHCESPACAANCPTGAMYKDEDGTVQHDDEACIGCQTCVKACPYEAPQYVEDWNIVTKCDTCRPLREAGELPVCVASCPLRALDFGEMDDLRAKYGDGLVSAAPFMPAADTTTPNLLMKLRETSLDGDFHEITL
ncbi:4Fe-4S dicluster domain-containing protein [Adlercreutzia sp. R25]|uniref:4Fe-4S dicluster domain-containing protein n=1 Tax=Adlercreutzia shanghongiae TaxID=3111773 RepID=UPI002DB7D6CA|nr:4Fe-4S dicluster domain-containing protein [Adlercreutzia sp. R25]MEC4271915.1 4Fe-4S dicluster domain-containing protein [Adlercreutzia sp. R25]